VEADAGKLFVDLDVPREARPTVGPDGPPGARALSRASRIAEYSSTAV
jgi:hypothetical protein